MEDKKKWERRGKQKQITEMLQTTIRIVIFKDWWKAKKHCSSVWNMGWSLLKGKRGSRSKVTLSQMQQWSQATSASQRSFTLTQHLQKSPLSKIWAADCKVDAILLQLLKIKIPPFTLLKLAEDPRELLFLQTVLIYINPIWNLSHKSVNSCKNDKPCDIWTYILLWVPNVHTYTTLINKYHCFMLCRNMLCKFLISVWMQKSWSFLSAFVLTQIHIL